MTRPAAVLELYCGIGGCAAALSGDRSRGREPAGRVVTAIDINHRALGVYGRNFPEHPALCRNLDGLRASDLARFGAHTWWLSPPCQPFTRRGHGRDADDPRARSFLRLVDHLAEVRPPALALENVPGFEGSRVHGRLRDVLDRSGYAVHETLLCPTRLGVPNRRRRFYLAAVLGGPSEAEALRTRTARAEEAERERWRGVRLRDLLDPALPPLGKASSTDEIPVEIPDELIVTPDLPRRYPHALHVVDAADDAAVTACFTAAYGRSPVRSGSYLRLEDGHLRRFSPREILRLLGFPESYSLPEDLPAAKAWPLVGNSLSVPAVRTVVRAIRS